MSILHDEGERNIGDIYLRNLTQNANLFLGLYTNETLLIESHNMSNIVEVSGGGYARISLTPVNWVRDVNQTSGNGTLYTQLTQVFNFNAALVNHIRGYFISTASTGGLLIASERFGIPVIVNQAGFRLEITPRIEFR